MLALFYSLITKLVQTSNTTVLRGETRQGIGRGVGCKLDKTKMETKSTDICAAPKWQPIGAAGGKTTCNALLFIYNRKPVVVEQGTSSQAAALNGWLFWASLPSEIFSQRLKNLIKPLIVPESWLSTGVGLLLHLMVALPGEGEGSQWKEHPLPTI